MNARLGVLLALTVSLSACRSERPPAPRPPEAHRIPHVQIVRRITTGEQRARFAVLQKRNPGRWVLESADQVDALTGIVRRARREDSSSGAGTALPSEQAEAAALRFVERNADLLGIPPGDLVRLTAEAASPRETLVLPSGHAAVAVTGTSPMRGFLSFPQLASQIRVAMTIDATGEVAAFVNDSTVHPQLAIGLDPDLREGDPRVVAKLLGRRVFALVVRDEPDAPPRIAGRVELGMVAAEDVRSVRPDILVTDGAMGAYRTYRLVYVVDVMKRGRASGQVFFFTWKVDADTGDVVEDARAPLVPEEP